jgi:hypothetical protein
MSKWTGPVNTAAFFFVELPELSSKVRRHDESLVHRTPDRFVPFFAPLGAFATRPYARAFRYTLKTSNTDPIGRHVLQTAPG